MEKVVRGEGDGEVWLVGGLEGDTEGREGSSGGINVDF